MTGYLMNFLVYTSAMVGIIFAAVFIYKKAMCPAASRSEFLGVEDSISLAPRKTLYVVRAGNERFLVASDVDKTSLISKLDEEYLCHSELDSESGDSESPTVARFRVKPGMTQDGEGSSTPFQRIMSRI
jgi:flagellar biogenesis protein FliO